MYRPFQPLLTKSGLQRFELSLQYARPNQILSGAVHSYLQVNTAKPTPYPVIPDGTQAIFISPDGVKLGGAQSRLHIIPILQAGDYFGIRFYPGALRYFFNLDISEVTNQLVDSRYIPCRKFAELNNKIYSRPSFRERALVCEQWLLGHFKPSAETSFDQALSLIYQSFGDIRIHQLAAAVGWSSRHLNRIFRYHTGLNTKTFAQAIRVQQLCKNLHKKPGDSLNTAHELGFFDQAHMIKDARKHLLSNPGEFINGFMSDFYNP